MTFSFYPHMAKATISTLTSKYYFFLFVDQISLIWNAVWYTEFRRWNIVTLCRHCKCCIVESGLYPPQHSGSAATWRPEVGLPLLLSQGQTQPTEQRSTVSSSGIGNMNAMCGFKKRTMQKTGFNSIFHYNSHKNISHVNAQTTNATFPLLMI